MGADRCDQPTLSRVGATLQAWTPGTAGGRFANASPILYGETDQAAAGAGAVGATIVAVDTTSQGMFGYETHTLTADGAQDITLALAPVPESVRVTIGGAPQVQPDDYTVSDDTLTLVTTHGLTGMVVDVAYAYATDIPDDTETG